MSSPKIISFVGKSNCGKTTLIEKLIPELNRRGYRAGAVKHHFHAGIDVDKPGKDTWRMAKAGASAIAMVSPGRMFILRDTQGEMSLEKVKDLLGEVDIILAEGFLSSAQEKIEVIRRENGAESLCREDELSALVTDIPFQRNGLAKFHLDDINGLADFLERRYLSKQD